MVSPIPDADCNPADYFPNRVGAPSFMLHGVCAGPRLTALAASSGQIPRRHVCAIARFR
jgi:hypothetical protein